MKLGIMGTGGIAHTVSKTLVQMPEIECFAAASRTLEKAEAFAAEFGFKKAYGSYEEMLADPEAQLVYICTPHSEHYENIKACLNAGKNVICEKAFTINAVQAAEVSALAKSKGLYLAEAIWTRYMPSRKIIDEVLASGIIGNVNIATANLSYVIAQNARIVDPKLAGGALLDVGVYGLNFALMHFGNDVERIETSVQMTDTGVDGVESLTLHFRGGRMAVLTHGIYTRGDRKGMFYGDKGYAVVENINDPSSISLYDVDDNLIKKIDMPEQISGYEYEFREAVKCIEEGRCESESMPLDESVFVLGLCDSIRKGWGLKYPQEQ